MEKPILFIASFIIAGAAFAIAWQVITRYFFGLSHGITEELPRLAMIIAVFLMAGPLMRNNRHVSMDLLPECLKGKAHSVLMILIHLFMLAGAAFMFIGGVEGVQFLKETDARAESEWNFPLWFIHLSLPAGMGILAIFVGEQLLRHFRILLAGQRDAAE